MILCSDNKMVLTISDINYYKENMKKQKLPVTVLSGFLGAGKTTLLNHILHHKGNMKVAVIVNDMSEINIDAQFVARENTLSRTDERLVEMSNGCICCTLREDLMQEVERLAQEGRFDYLLIESTGISEPIPIAQTFSYVDEENGIDLSSFSYIDTMVTVVDCYNFFKDFGSADTLIDRSLAEDFNDHRTVVNLLTDQIEFANVIILNKTDLVHSEIVGTLKAAIYRLNPTAQVVESLFGKVDPKVIIGTQLFDFEKAASSTGWIKELESDHIPETDEYGISSFVFRAAKPFHPQRWYRYLQECYPQNILRAKGLFWLASRPNAAIALSQAGGSLRIENAGVWWCSMPAVERIRYDNYLQHRSIIEAGWHPEWKDRKNELVFIGQDLDKITCIQELERCLITDEEADDWRFTSWKDEFPEYM